MAIDFGSIAVSLQRALVGEIVPEIRAICLEVTDEAVTVTVAHDGVLAQELADDLDAATTEVYADFPELGAKWPLRLAFDRRDRPSAVPTIGIPVFAVKGTQFLSVVAHR